MAEKAAKEAKAKADTASKAVALGGLVSMELEQEKKEALRRQHVQRHQPSLLDATASSSGEEFDFAEADNASETDDSDEMDVDAQADGHADAAVQTPVSMIL